MTTHDLTHSEDLATRIVPRARDLGGFSVRRALPSPQRQMVGPFIFFDQMGPADFKPSDKGIDVRPHPHIGLATVTYLFQGKIRHRDSLGTTQDIEPGAVNWMTAGKGITHSERTPEDLQGTAYGMFGIQTWIALPKDKEEMDPAFIHHGKDALPTLDGDGLHGKLILGDAYGASSPVETASDTFYADVTIAPGTKLPLPDNQEDRGIYVVQGSVELADKQIGEAEMLVFGDGPQAVKAGPDGARVMVFGGGVMDGPRHIWWNFVASDKDMIEAAKADWKKEGHGRFTLPPNDDQEFIPID
ncbi:pirin family protein [Parvularcula sp. ZS-1/3]|uniref:Pirin family protein n=1 Tax=Parvularcula mediterranea TaxID=2732508 RepID=A0A7Y3W5Q4_9PROT|nr:pirin family protein [Parvularcula mediterranea]NNU16567.1 pirin family protein [Parvularcula mediterranea]